MPGMSNEIIARQRVQELVRRGEEERRSAGLRADRLRARRGVLAALSRWHSHRGARGRLAIKRGKREPCRACPSLERR